MVQVKCKSAQGAARVRLLCISREKLPLLAFCFYIRLQIEKEVSPHGTRALSLSISQSDKALGVLQLGEIV